MLQLFINPKDENQIWSIINSEHRLAELITIQDIAAITDVGNFDHLIVQEEGIRLPLIWSNEEPPYIFQNLIPFSVENLLALTYFKLENYDKAYHFAENNAILLADIDTQNCLKHGISLRIDEEISPIESFSKFDIYRHWHNLAVKSYYGETINFVNIYQIKVFFQKAIEAAPNDEYVAYTVKHFASLLLDAEELDNAEILLENTVKQAISEGAKHELMAIQYGVWLKKLGVPYDEQLLSKIKETLWSVLQYYENRNNQIQVALLLVDAAQIANISESFTEALGYISRAVDILRKEEIPELLANAQYRRGVLFYTWAQNGNLQFYKPAMEAYQEALKVFNYENAPDIFAEIQHHLGVIYSEIPDEAKKKSLWAAVSVSSFNQALNHFTRETHPFEFSMICNSYANALTKYPPSVKSDNFAKALNLYRQALEIRTISEYPYERVLTILNFLEACWFVNLENEKEEQALFEEMSQLANEVTHLTNDEKLIQDAKQHLEKIHKLSKLLA